MRSRRRREQPPGENQFRTDFDAPVKRPWFGPKRFGYGYAPRTWQGYLIMAGLLAVVLVLGALAKEGRFPAALVVVPGILVAVGIRLFQRR
jgi:hypothetical protein